MPEIHKKCIMNRCFLSCGTESVYEIDYRIQFALGWYFRCITYFENLIRNQRFAKSSITDGSIKICGTDLLKKGIMIIDTQICSTSHPSQRNFFAEKR